MKEQQTIQQGDATTNEIRPVIAIIGGGVSGTLTAYHLIRSGQSARVIVIDPREELGLGLAYSTPSLRHLLNVPAGKISALPNDSEHFLRWLRKNGDPGATAESFAPRAVFGQYVRSIVQDVAGLEHVRASVIDCQIELDRSGNTQVAAVLTLNDRQTLRADRVVLAMGNFDPAPLPGIDPATVVAGTYHHNAWSADAYENLAADAPVTLIGTGLTAVDVLLRLREQGHRGVVTAISRHAVFPYRHQSHPTLAAAAIPADTPATCLGYLRAIRPAIDGGADWRSVIDSLRATTNTLWLRLPHEEQRRFKRHLQRRWDVARHRMAPPVADALDAERESGTLLQRHGHLVGIAPAESSDGAPMAIVTIQTRQGLERLTAARVINCTGPSMNYRRVGSTLLSGLLGRGVTTPGPHGAGLRCDDNGALIDADGKRSDVLFNVGPGRLGTLLESIAVPELRQQAVDLAKMLGEKIDRTDSRAA